MRAPSLSPITAQPHSQLKKLFAVLRLLFLWNKFIFVEWVSPSTQLSQGITPDKTKQKQRVCLYLWTMATMMVLFT